MTNSWTIATRNYWSLPYIKFTGAIGNFIICDFPITAIFAGVIVDGAEVDNTYSGQSDANCVSKAQKGCSVFRALPYLLIEGQNIRGKTRRCGG
jgi:hypothetical protein